jgi:diamine N-acetyltransferase
MLKAQNIYLRTIEPRDAALMLEWENNPENWAVSNTLVPFSEHLILQYVNSAQDIFETKQLRFIICLQEDDKPIGTIDLFEYDPLHRKAGIGVLIDEVNERKKGYASEALKLMIKYSFERLDLHQLFCNIFESNEQSIKLFENNNFVKKGEKIDWVRLEGKWETELFYQLINKDD